MKRGRGRPKKAAPRATREPRNEWESLMQARAASEPLRNTDCILYLACLDHYTKRDMVFSCRFCCFEADSRRRDDPFDNDERTELLAICRLMLALFYEKGNEYEADV